MIANSGGDECKIVRPRAVEFDAYDRLPSDIRRRLQDMAIQWVAVGCQTVIAKHGLGVLAATLDKIEGDMQAARRRASVVAWRERLAA